MESYNISFLNQIMHIGLTQSQEYGTKYFESCCRTGMLGCTPQIGQELVGKAELRCQFGFFKSL